MTKFSVVIGAALVPGVAFAHPGHAAGGAWDLGHYLTDPFHLALTVGAVLLVLGVRRSLRRSWSDKTVR